MSIVICEDCDKFIDTDFDVEALDDDIVRCKSCRENRDEAAYERQQEKAFTGYWEGQGISDEVRLNRELRDAGRGHLASDLADIATISDERRNK